MEYRRHMIRDVSQGGVEGKGVVEGVLSMVLRSHDIIDGGEGNVVRM